MVGKGPIYGWPLRLTRVGCEGVDIWKKKWFSSQGGCKANMVEGDLSRHEKEVQHQKGEGEEEKEKREDGERNAAPRKQSMG